MHALYTLCITVNEYAYRELNVSYVYIHLYVSMCIYASHYMLCPCSVCDPWPIRIYMHHVSLYMRVCAYRELYTMHNIPILCTQAYMFVACTCKFLESIWIYMDLDGIYMDLYVSICVTYYCILINMDLYESMWIYIHNVLLHMNLYGSIQAARECNVRKNIMCGEKCNVRKSPASGNPAADFQTWQHITLTSGLYGSISCTPQ